MKLLSVKTDTVKVQMDEKERKRFRSSWVKTSTGAPAPFSMSINDLSVANQHSMNVTAQLEWNGEETFENIRERRVQIKSNGWKRAYIRNFADILIGICF